MRRIWTLGSLTLVCLTATIVSSVVFLHRRAAKANTRPLAGYATQSHSFQPRSPKLNVDSVTQHGHIVEIKGEAEPGASVMVNGERAAVIFDGSRFKHFVGPLPRGVTVITVTVQDDQGGVNTKTIAVDIP